MKNEVLLTIGIPTFNRAVWLDNSLNILIPQLKVIGLEIELVISNNASIDQTDEVIEKYRSAFPIIYNKNQENIGAIKNIYKCLCLANGKYVWILGDDDFVERNFLYRFLEVIKKNGNISLFFVNMRVWSSNDVYKYGDTIEPKLDIENKEYLEVDLEYVIIDSIKEIATLEKGYFNAISNIILLREDYLLSFKIGAESGSEFTSIESTFPHSYYIAKELLNKSCVEIINSALICFDAVSWKRYYEITWLKWFPELIILMQRNGLDKEKATLDRKRIIKTKFPEMIPKLIRGKIDNYEYFSYYKFFKDNYYIPYFWISLIKVLINELTNIFAHNDK